MKKENRKGQSLIEILIATAIGAIIIASVAGLLISILRLNSDANNIQASAGLAKETLGEVQNFSQSNWYNIYNLAKDGTPYYFVATGTTFQAVTGTESVAIAQSDILTGLAGYWKLDESTGSYAFDSSGNSNLGTIYYATRQAGTNCIGGGCLSFNGTSSYVYFNNSPSLSPANITVSAWINPNSLSGTSDAASTYGSGTNTWVLRASQGGDAHFYPMIYMSSAWHNCDGGLISLNKWSNIVLTYDGAILKGYVNGNFVCQNNSFSGNLPTTGVAQTEIGATNNVNYFSGSIDDVRIYNTALSSTTIQNLYQAQFYSRDFTVSNVNRDNGNITLNPGSDDPSTQLINIYYNWPNGSTSTLPIYLTRYSDQVTYQNDWSGGAGQSGPITIPNNLFSSSTFIDYTSSTGAIIIKGF